MTSHQVAWRCRRASAARKEGRLRRSIAGALGIVSLASVGCSDVGIAKLKGYLGSTDAQMRLGYAYGTGSGVERDDAESVRW